MTEGLISVIMGIYKCADTLPEAIESIQNQTYTKWELILCDDCSPDSTYEIAKKYADADERIILLKNEKNSKLAYTLNHCLKYASGEYVARMDGDDISLPERFEKQVAFLRNNPQVVLCGTAMQRFSDAGLGAIDYAPSEPNRYTQRKTTPFNHATIMTYKWLYDELNGYTVCDRTVRGQDQDLWYRFFYKGFNGANLEEPLYMVREDEAAIRRRTPHDYWIGLQTKFYGYHLLGYPWHWYIRPILNMYKCFVPVSVVIKYREWQKKKQDRANK